MKYLFILIILIGSFSFGQNTSYIDSLKTSISKFPESEQLHIINAISYDKYVGEIKKSEDVFLYAADIAEKLKDSLALGDIYYKLSEINSFKER